MGSVAAVRPQIPTRPQGGGRRRVDDRAVLAAIIFVATSGCTWRQLPPVFDASWQTVHRRFSEWTASPTSGQNARRQGLRLRPPAEMAPFSEHHAAHRAQGHRILPTSRPSPLDRGADGGLAVRVQSSAPPLRTQGRALPRLRRHRCHPHLLPEIDQLRRSLMRTVARELTTHPTVGAARRPYGSVSPCSGLDKAPSTPAHDG